MQLRRLIPTDAHVYRRMMLDAYERHPDAFTSSAAERAPLALAWWEQRLSSAPDAGDVVLGAFAGERLTGVVGLSFTPREKACLKAQLFGMVVDPAWRNQGVGRLLVLGALAHARERAAVTVVQLTVTQGNRAASQLYLGCGFSAFGVEPMALKLGAGYLAKIHMWCALG